jgi:glutathione-regulated potassium-efflux system ancillary protein KefG
MLDPQARVLVLLAHPSLQRSNINKTLKNAIDNIDGVTVHDLYDSYPEFYIDVKHEQKLLQQHDLIVFQHPLYWYSVTPMLKLWQDVVFTPGFAYGNGGNALQGKHFIQVISTAGKEQAFTSTGYNAFTIDQLSAPLKATINMCGMLFHSPLVLHHSDEIPDAELAKHTVRYRKLLVDFTLHGASCFTQEES